MDVAVIGGAGTVGVTTAYTLSLLKPDVDVTLVDVAEDAATGHAIDMRTALGHASHPAGRNFPNGDGTVRAAEPGAEAVAEADCVVMAASVPRPDDSAGRGGRLAFLERNGVLVEEIASWLGRVEPRPVVTVTNPLDPINYRLFRALDWDRRYCIGYALSETARLADQIAQRADVAPAAVSCPTMGEHGEHLVPVFSRATVDGEPVSFSADEREELTEAVNDLPWDVIRLRGHEETSRWVTGRGVASLVASVLEGGPSDPVCCSVPLDGEYGYRNLSLSVPVRLSADGVEEIVEWELSATERRKLDEAADAVGELCQ
ncbi:malate dehydrogenase [Halorussus sp. AFM4]|uniref:malate dehydrogenase n=1 Tax=Halorussus sp. AFM4 TaxID=3421651 RepID=UPI003EBED2E6